MIPVPASTRIGLAAGVTEMRKGFTGLVGAGRDGSQGGPVLRSSVCVPGSARRSDQSDLVGPKGDRLSQISKGP
jgi:hypothetical protein